MSIVSLVIAPFIAGKTFGERPNHGQGAACVEMQHCEKEMMGKCDMSKCATMTKEQCAAMCDSMGCDSTEKAACMGMYDADGKFIGKGHEGCSNEPACKEDNDKTCSKGDACCKNKKVEAPEKKACCKDKK
jgi:K(+)-stimulated pyrophosphate-energized sodium pump